jgi:hypothetical protein
LKTTLIITQYTDGRLPHLGAIQNAKQRKPDAAHQLDGIPTAAMVARYRPVYENAHGKAWELHGLPARVEIKLTQLRLH